MTVAVWIKFWKMLDLGTEDEALTVFQDADQSGEEDGHLDAMEFWTMCRQFLYQRPFSFWRG